MKKILITGGDGRFANELKKFRTVFKMIFLSKRELNISSSKSIKKILKNLNRIMFFIQLVYQGQ